MTATARAVPVLPSSANSSSHSPNRSPSKRSSRPGRALRQRSRSKRVVSWAGVAEATISPQDSSP